MSPRLLMRSPCGYEQKLAAKLGRAGQEQVKRDFRQDEIWDDMRREYLEILRARDRKLFHPLSAPTLIAKNGS